jgi:hypothetical protein
MSKTKNKKVDPLITVPEAVAQISKQCTKLIGIQACVACKAILAKHPPSDPRIRQFAFCTALDEDDDLTDSHIIVGHQALSKLSQAMVETPGADLVSSLYKMNME